jgi:hypothetical protein
MMLIAGLLASCILMFLDRLPKRICSPADQRQYELVSESVEIKYLDVCKEAIAEMYILWRQIDSLPSLTKAIWSEEIDPPQRHDLGKLASTMAAIENYERTYSPFMRQCFENCSKLSIRTRAFSGKFGDSFRPFN